MPTRPSSARSRSRRHEPDRPEPRAKLRLLPSGRAQRERVNAEPISEEVYWALSQEPRIDIEQLRGRWQTAFDAALAALGHAALYVPANELRDRGSRLAVERDLTTELLQALARDESRQPPDLAADRLSMGGEAIARTPSRCRRVRLQPRRRADRQRRDSCRRLDGDLRRVHLTADRADRRSLRTVQPAHRLPTAHARQATARRCACISRQSWDHTQTPGPSSSAPGSPTSSTRAWTETRSQPKAYVPSRHQTFSSRRAGGWASTPGMRPPSKHLRPASRRHELPAFGPSSPSTAQGLQPCCRTGPTP